jgi:hypothetical protein
MAPDCHEMAACAWINPHGINASLADTTAVAQIAFKKALFALAQ